ncbi:site-specific DNA-methyltransferase [candidate division KSB1 bacterium]|nr:site-specific DNA-methyltransferase [candidate division KSB1 bacterium]MBL7094076.1 site-specific DNA-methyltransferase [candidate division KSB1 bacterium]
MYKEIVLSYDKALNAKEITALNLFNESFKDDEIKLDFDQNRVIVLLRKIDITTLKETANRLSSYAEKPLFSDIVFSIEKIKSYGIQGKKRNYIDYNKERKVKNRNQKEKKRGQFFYAQDNNFTKGSNEIDKQYENKIICDDSEKVLKNIPDNTIDLVFTSPPYNFGLDYNKNEDDHYWENYFSKLFKIFDQCIRVLKYGGRIIVNIQPLFSDYIPSHHMISNYFIKKKLIWKGEILWEKNNYNCKYTAWGSWKSPSSPYLKYTWEFLEIFSKGALKKDGDKNNIDISADEFKQWVVAKWSIAPERKMKKYGHPAMFPENLVERVLKLFSFKGDIVLDPFNGVGTTCLVAKKFGRKFLGIDISEEYCKTAEERLKMLEGKMELVER